VLEIPMSRRNVLAAPMAAAFLVAAPAQLCLAEVPAPLLACAAESDDARRLACFDRAVAQMGEAAEAGTPARAPAPAGAPPASAPASAPATAPAAVQAAPAAAAVVAAPSPAAASSRPQLSPEEEFGLRGSAEREERNELTGLTAKATAISTKLHGELVVTLDNGQVWAEIAPGSKIRVKPGDPVRIEAGTLRSFILIAPNGRSSKVVRVR
jgi:hypothetical protein